MAIKEIDTKNCRLVGDTLHVQFTSGESYVFSLGEIVFQCAGGLTQHALDLPSTRMCRCGAVNYESHKRWCPADTASQ